jgi:hypothetical protein
MRKITLLFVFISIFIALNISYSQGFTPPKMVFGVSLDGNFATNDAHGSNIFDPQAFGMVWGRGISAYYKLGFGVRRNHRLTIGATYNLMINDTKNDVPFFVFTPKDGDFTSYNLWTGSVGYEYAFNPRCKTKQFIGVALTQTLLTSSAGSIYSFENAVRLGLQITTGYEFVLDKNYKTGLLIGLKYSLTNILGTQNGVNRLNDGSDSPGALYWRRIGILSLNVGFNLYSGVQPYKSRL